MSSRHPSGASKRRKQREEKEAKKKACKLTQFFTTVSGSTSRDDEHGHNVFNVSSNAEQTELPQSARNQDKNNCEIFDPSVFSSKTQKAASGDLADSTESTSMSSDDNFEKYMKNNSDIALWKVNERLRDCIIHFGVDGCRNRDGIYAASKRHYDEMTSGSRVS
jgi:hypothetical protein